MLCCTRRIATPAVFVLATGTAIGAGAQSLRPIAVRGDAAAGLPGVTTDSVIRWARSGDAYSVFASVTGAGVDASNDKILFRTSGAGSELVARNADTAPGLPDGVFAMADLTPAFGFGVIFQHDRTDDRLVFGAMTDAPTLDPVNNVVLWSYTSSEGLGILHLPGDPIDTGSSLQNGEIAGFQRFADAPEKIGFARAIYYPASQAHSYGPILQDFVATEPGEPVTQRQPVLSFLSEGELSFSIGPDEPLLSDDPATLPEYIDGFYTTGQPGVDSSNDHAVFVLQPTGVYREIIREGDPAPGYADRVFNSIRDLYVAPDGSGALANANLRDPTGSINDNGFWRIQGETVSLVTGTGIPLDVIDNEPVPRFRTVFTRQTREGVVADITWPTTTPICETRREMLHIGFDATVELIPFYGNPIPGSGGVMADYCREARFFASPESEDFVIRQVGSYDGYVFVDRSSGQLLPLPAEGRPFDFSAAQDGSRVQTVQSVGISAKLVADGTVAFRVETDDPSVDGLYEFKVVEPDAPCVADTNGDGFLSPADFNAWILAFNNQAPACDQNGDELCTPSDFNGWIINFNAGCT